MPEQSVKERIIQTIQPPSVPTTTTGSVVDIYPVRITNIEDVRGSITSSSSDYACLIKSMESARILGDTGAITVRSAEHLGYSTTTLETSQPMKVLETDLVGGIKITSDATVSFKVNAEIQPQLVGPINEQQAIVTRPQSVTAANQRERVIEITAVVRAKENFPSQLEQPVTTTSQTTGSWTQFKDDPVIKR